ncbi:hypothetical protein [Aliidiomarina indica]|uniref:hypothetical protein n=1 Tax=Aliidiomarina indica TaxID=2749147 RepID=UPI0018905DED|nr:hypothetical protein [Aliidiomarina indica]
MKNALKLVLLIALYISLSGKVEANQCLSFSSHSNAFCQTTYTYERETLFFDSSVIGEQSIKLERISEKATGDIVHIDFIFQGNCTEKGYCDLSTEAFLDMYIEGFRTAVINGGLYEYVPDDCDPTMEICCDDFQCTEIQSDPSNPEELNNESAMMSESELSSDSTVMNSRVGFVKKFLDSVWATLGSELTSRALDSALSNEQFMSDALTGSKFTIVTHHGDQFICKINGPTCETIDGYFSNSGAVFYTDSYDEARSLRDFLQEYYNFYHIQCWSQMTCDTAESCVITYYCN